MVLINTSDREAIGVRVPKLYPQGSRIAIRVNPRAPDVSIVVAGDNTSHYAHEALRAECKQSYSHGLSPLFLHPVVVCDSLPLL